MTITQTVEIPASHRLTIEVPREVPAGRTVLAFTPALEAKKTEPSGTGFDVEAEYRRRKALAEHDAERINRDAEWLNREAMDVLLDQELAL